ncbi:MAG TPA: lactate utilization protein C [Planctomycetota bacterium]|nr:lactate utilization protein C [Planctomycetota bacterium]
MKSREVILGAVCSHLRRTPDSDVAAPPPVPALGRVDLPAAGRLEQFAQRLRDVGGTFHLGLDDGGLAAVTGLLARLAPRSIAASDARAVQALRQHAQLAPYAWLPAAATHEQLFAADVGITGAQWAIAETGTLVLDSAQERHRLASLLPPVHIALLPVSRLLCSMGEVLKTLDRPLPCAATFVTGPSRTADIELKLIVGVHGPRELHVVVV